MRSCNSDPQCKVHGLSMIGKLTQGDSGSLIEENAVSYLSYDEDLDLPAAKGNLVKAYVWGLNDKDQLGGIKGSKVKFPTYSEEISKLKAAQICCGSKSIFILSNDGKIFAAGEGTNGRLGLGHANNMAQPKQIMSLATQIIKKVAVHPGGRHCLALTVDGKVYSWGKHIYLT